MDLNGLFWINQGNPRTRCRAAYSVTYTGMIWNLTGMETIDLTIAQPGDIL